MIELEAGHKEGKNKCRFCTIALYKSEFDFSENSTKNIYKGEQWEWLRSKAMGMAQYAYTCTYVVVVSIVQTAAEKLGGRQCKQHGFLYI